MSKEQFPIEGLNKILNIVTENSITFHGLHCAYLRCPYLNKHGTIHHFPNLKCYDLINILY